MKKTLIAAAIAALPLCTASAGSSTSDTALSTLPRVANVDVRFQSYNVEMVEVTGGRFWAPYGGPPGELHRQRPPLDLADKRLIALARHLGPAYMRVSGTWANNSYLLADDETLAAPPKGFEQILTREQWKSVIAFAKAVDARIVTSFAVSNGTRDADGVWQPDQAQRLVDLTNEAGGTLYAAEFFNEPNIPGVPRSMPDRYDADRYGADFRAFRRWARSAVPGMKLIGTGGADETGMLAQAPPGSNSPLSVRSEDMLAANPNSLDGVSYHFYGSVSPRCARDGPWAVRKDLALSPQRLDRTLTEYDFYARLRDRYEPGKPMWLTETGESACGGSPWASTFVDSFRYLDQLGSLARKGVQAVMHNTLFASDYALVDQDSLTPRPSYWAAVLWRRTMGQTVLAAPDLGSKDLRAFAHCLPDKQGGVGLMILNIGTTRRTIPIGRKASAWIMAGTPLETRTVQVNGAVPYLDDKGNLIGLDGKTIKGSLSLAGQSIAFIAVPGIDNPACW